MLNSNHKRIRESSSEKDDEKPTPFQNLDNMSENDDQKDESTSGNLPNLKKKKLMDNVVVDDLILDHSDVQLDSIQNFFLNTAKAVECKKIGAGGFGDVYLVRKGETLKAVKKIRNVNQAYSGFEEVFQIIKLNHDHIIDIDDYHLINGEFCFEMDYYSKGSLVDYKNKLSVNQVFQIACQICDALKYISENGICHRDVKIPNILVKEIDDSHINVVLTDFGLSFRKNSYKPYEFEAGTTDYYDPSIINYFKLTNEQKVVTEFPYKTETDLYALGVTLERLTNRSEVRNDALLKEVINKLKNVNHEERIEIMNELATISSSMRRAFKNPKNITNWDKYLEACILNSLCFRFCPYKDKHFVKSVAAINPTILEFVSDGILEDVLSTAIETNFTSILFFHHRLKEKKKETVSGMMVNIFHEIRLANKISRIPFSSMTLEDLKILVRYIPHLIAYYPDTYKLEKDHVMSFIAMNIKCYEHCAFSDDEEITEWVLERDCTLLKYASRRLVLKYEPILARRMVELDSFYYRNITDKSNREVSKIAIVNNISNFDYLPEELRNDQQFLMDLVRENPETFPKCKQYLKRESLIEIISPELYGKLDYREKLNEEILGKLLKNLSFKDFEFIVQSLRAHSKLGRNLFEIIPIESVLQLAKLDAPLKDLSYFNEDLDFIIELVRITPRHRVEDFLDSFSINTSKIDAQLMEKMQQLPNFFFLLEVLDVKQLVLQFSNDFQLINGIIKTNPKLFEYLPVHLQRNPQIIDTYLTSIRYFARYNEKLPSLPSDMLLDLDLQSKHIEALMKFKYISQPSPEVIKLAIFKHKDIGFLEHLEITYLNDKQFMMLILKEFPFAFRYLKTLKIDKEIIKMLIELDEQIYWFIDDTLKKDDEILFILNKPKSSIESILDEINDLDMRDI